jgi:hypothetical protein
MSAVRESRLFQIFRAGTHTSMAGSRLTFTPADLRTIAASYRILSESAPLCLGHPPDNRPSYGEVTELIEDNGKLFANALIAPALIDAVKKHRYKHVSAAFNAAGNLPFLFTLRHVGFLGGHPPAVRGMDALSFSETGPGRVLCFSEGGELFAEPRGTADRTAQALAARVESYREMVPILTYWRAYGLATTR